MNYLQNIVDAFERYLADTRWEAVTFWGILLGAVLAGYLLTIAVSKTLGVLATSPEKAPSDATALFTAEFRLRRAFVWAACLIAAIAFGCLAASAQTILPRSIELRFPLLVILVIALIWGFVRLRGLQKDFTLEGLPGLVGRSVTPRDQSRRSEAARRACDRLKWLFFIPLLGLAALLIGYFKSGTHIAIVLDNSGSMDVHIANAKSILTHLLGEMRSSSTISVTVFPDTWHPGKGHPVDDQPLAEAMKIKATSASDPKLPGDVHEFGSPAEAVDYLRGDIPVGGSSPIGEAIWKTYLLRSAATGGRGNSAQPSTLIVVTDGDEPVANFGAGAFFYSDPGFAATFPPEMSHLIDVNGQMNNVFFNAGTSAGCQVHTGIDSQDLESSMRSILEDDLLEWPVLAMAIVAVAIFGLLVLFSRPNRLPVYA